MRRLTTSILTAVLGLGLTGAAGAATVEWSGTLVVDTGRWGHFEHYGTGVATINGSGGGEHINTIYWTKGLTFTGGNNVPETLQLTDPATPTFVTLRATGLRLGTQTFDGISGGPPLGTKNTGVPPGRLKMCILFPGCGNYTPIPFATAGGNIGIGVGGQFTIGVPSKGGLVLSVFGAPWTIGLASIRSVTTETPNGAITTYTKTIQGFAHGPASGSTTAAISGVLQMVTPALVLANKPPPDRRQAWTFEVRLHFIPEPRVLLLLGPGIAGLLLLGRRRICK